MGNLVRLVCEHAVKDDAQVLWLAFTWYYVAFTLDLKLVGGQSVCEVEANCTYRFPNVEF